MKQTWKKIGKQRSKSFPVAFACFHVIAKGSICSIDKQPALFGISLYNVTLEEVSSLQQIFSDTELQGVLWERAYRRQKDGVDEHSPLFPICVPCTLKRLTAFLGMPENECIPFIIGAMATTRSIMLFDRNLRRDMTHPGVALGFFETLADFRQQYWQETET